MLLTVSSLSQPMKPVSVHSQYTIGFLYWNSFAINSHSLYTVVFNSIVQPVNQSEIVKMAGKVSTIVSLSALVLVLGILIATSEGSRRKGKFTTPGGSHCRWMEKKRHNDTDVSYTLKCRCHSKGGGVMRYRCTYQTSFRGRGRNSLQLSDSFLQFIKGNLVLCWVIDIE